jgi:putative membrane protein
MVGFLLRALITALALWVAAKLLSGVHFTTGTQLALAAVRARRRSTRSCGRSAFILTLPITVLTLGLFLLVLNAAMIGLVALILPGFSVSGFWTAVGAAIIVSLVSWAASTIIGNSGRGGAFLASPPVGALHVSRFRGRGRPKAG